MLTLDDAVTVELCLLARAAGYPWSDTVDLHAASQWAAQRLTLNTDAVTVDGKPACTATLRLDDGREWSAGGPNAGAAMRTLAAVVRRAVRDGAAVTLLAHPRADRRALVAAEVRVMLRDLACASVAAALGGRVGDRERWERAYGETVRLLDAGDVGNAHSVASVALGHHDVRSGAQRTGQVRT